MNNMYLLLKTLAQFIVWIGFAFAAAAVISLIGYMISTMYSFWGWLLS